MADSVGSLELEAQKRRDRLKGLRKEAEPVSAENSTEKNSAENSTTDPSTEQSAALPQAKFRSYVPKLPELQDSVVAKLPPMDVAGMVQDQLEAALPTDLPEDMELTNLAPRKPDWDLKRDVAKSLDRLERRTQRAVAELIRERLALQKDTTDLAEAVTYGAKIQEEQAAADEWWQEKSDCCFSILVLTAVNSHGYIRLIDWLIDWLIWTIHSVPSISQSIDWLIDFRAL